MSDAIDLGGARFVPVERSTLRQETYFSRLLGAAGLEGVKREPSETSEDFGWRLFAHLVGAGVLFEMLGTLLMPEGVKLEDWTPELAHATAIHVGDLIEDEDKQKARRLIVELLVPFMTEGLASWRTSASSSATSGADQAAHAGSASSDSGSHLSAG